MSNFEKTVEQTCDSEHPPATAVELLIKPRHTQLAGIDIHRVLPTRERRMIGPWIFFDHMGPVDFPPGQGVNVPPHPHIGLATVTYLFSGELLHRDSLGSEQVIVPGDINLMVSGQGIVHSERERSEVTAQAHHMHGLQLWLALPHSEERCLPSFHHYESKHLPTVQIGDVAVRVLMGKAYNTQSPVKTFSDTLYCEARLGSDQVLTMPQAAERALYVVDGVVQIGGEWVHTHELAILTPGTQVTVLAKQPATIAIIGGDPVGQRYIDWNFVASSTAQLKQAKDDWIHHRFDPVPGDEEDFVPYPGQ